MIALLRYLTGYVLVLATGNNVGRFFNLCVNNGITFWNVESLGEDRYRFYLSKKDIWKLRPYLHKTRTHLKIQKKYGIPFLLFRYRKRILFPIALTLVMLLFGYVSQFIWKVEIHGNSYLTEEVLISYLRKENAAFGAKKSKIDCDQLELSLREDFAQVIWASVSIEGTDLIVEIQEKTAAPAGTEDQEAAVETAAVGSYNLVADCDATICSIITRKGTPQVKAGDVVHTGDILVVGHQEVLDDAGEVKLVLDGTADADIIGEVVYEYKDTIPIVITKRMRGESQTAKLRIDFFGKSLSIPLGFHKYDLTETVQEYHQLHLTNQFYLPVGIEISTEYELTEQEYERSEAEALAAAEKNLINFLAEKEENGVSIMEKNVMMRKDEKIYQVYGTVTGQKKIGTLAPDMGKEQVNDEYE